jgi:hypothetical protein
MVYIVIKISFLSLPGNVRKVFTQCNAKNIKGIVPVYGGFYFLSLFSLGFPTYCFFNSLFLVLDIFKWFTLTPHNYANFIVPFGGFLQAF